MGRIEEFLAQYQTGTRYSYSTGVNAFLSYIYKHKRTGGQRITPEERQRFEMFADTYFSEGRDYEKDLIAFSIYCTEHYAPTSGRHLLAVVKEFLLFNDIEFTRKQERNIRNKSVEGGPVSEEAELSKELLRNLLNACDIRMKALVLTLLTSGMRIGEVVKLRKEDIEFAADGTYGIVTLRGVSRIRGDKLKNRHSRTTFIGKEAVEVLKQWYEVREKFLETSCKRSRNRWDLSDRDDGRIFPFGVPTLSESLRASLKRANIFTKDEETGRATVHFHLFRKYFITTLTYAGIPEKYIDFFAGHLGELDRAYQRPTKEKLLEKYLKGEPYLRIYDNSAEEIAQTKEQFKAATEGMRDLRIENLEMKSKMQDFERVKDRMHDLEERLETIKKLDKVQGQLTPEDQMAIAKLIVSLQKKQKR